MNIKYLQKEIILLLDYEKRFWHRMRVDALNFNDKNMFATGETAVEVIELEINKLFREHYEIYPNE